MPLHYSLNSWQTIGLDSTDLPGDCKLRVDLTHTFINKTRRNVNDAKPKGVPFLNTYKHHYGN